MGNKLKMFEEEYAQFNRVNHAIGVSNGLDALFLCLKALGVREGDEVIVPSNTFIATVLAVSYTGATPVFVEPDIQTYLIDPKNILRAITSKTKAIMPVHLFGQACEMDKIMELAKTYDLKVVEDNAQAHGSTFSGKITGSWGNLNGVSFYPGKNLGALGDAGAITTDSLEMAEKVRILRNYGSNKKYHNCEIGYNNRLDELQAAILSIKLKYINQWNFERKEIASWYNQALKDIGDLILPHTHEQSTHVYHLYVIRTTKRDLLKEFLENQELGSIIHYTIPPHLQEAYKSLGYSRGDFPVAEELADSSLSLPLWPGMTRNDVDFVAEQIKHFFSDHM